MQYFVYTVPQMRASAYYPIYHQYPVYNKNLTLSSLNLAYVNGIMGIFQFVQWDSH